MELGTAERAHQLCSKSIVSQHSGQPVSPSPHSQELSTCHYHEPDQSSSNQPILSLQQKSSIYVLVFLVVSSLLLFLPITYTLAC
jgi:hypothetical protein